MRRLLSSGGRSAVPSFIALATLVATFVAPTGPIRALVINEIMYHTADLQDGPFEWIEFFNEKPDPFDLSNYAMCNGVAYTFPEGTIMPGRTYLILCADEASFNSRYDVPADTVVLDGWTGALDNSGENLDLCNPAGVSILRVGYNDRGKWPGGADGTGHSLSLIDPFTDSDDPDSWTISKSQLGTPGEANGHVSLEGGPPPESSAGFDFNGFILHWLVLGPYTGSGCDLGATTIRADWLRNSNNSVNQTDLLWEDGQVVPTNYSVARSTGLHPNAGSATPRVERFAAFNDIVNFNDAVYPPDPDQVMAYAFTYVDNVTGSTIPIDVGVGSDDAIAVMVNGVHVMVDDACRGVGGVGVVQNRAPAQLLPGKNLITVKVFENGGGWSFRLRLERRGSGASLAPRSEIQVTTDHTLGMGFDGSGDPIEDPGEDPGPDPEDDPTRFTPFPVVINEALILTGGERWIELYNRGTEEFDLSGYYLTDESGQLAKAALPNNTRIPAGGYLDYTEGELGLDFSILTVGDRRFIALVDPDGETVVDAYNFEPKFDNMTEARLPDGDAEFDDASDPTRGAANSMTVEDSIVINEILYHPIDNDRKREFVELYNRGSQVVNMGNWELTRGVNWVFEPGTSLGPNQYLVVARDPDFIRSTYGLPASSVVGPDPADPEAIEAFGQLRDGGERVTLKDEIGRTVDTVRYFDGGEWARLADGHGSSLELIDPSQDNRFGQAWDASDDSDKSVVNDFEYVARHTSGESELHVKLLSLGISIVDDFSVKGSVSSGSNEDALIQAGSEWRYIKGTQAPPANWNSRTFNDSSWLRGDTSIGYGDDDDATILNDMEDGYMTIFCRKSFSVANPAAVEQLLLRVTVDDGFYAYLNGTQVASFNVTSTAFDAAAPSAVGDGDLVERDISSFKHLLIAGTNVLAIQVHNAGLGSSDLTFNPELLDSDPEFTANGPELVVNGTFNSNQNNWVIQGNHIRSGRTTVNRITGSGSLKIVATGRGDNKVNRIETSNSGMQNMASNADHLVSFKAKWVVGSPTILTHSDRHGLARSHRMLIPENLGTPGRINSVTARLSGNPATANLGPVVTDVWHSPTVPGPNETVTVRARVSDSDGISNVRLRYSLNNPSGAPLSRTMTHIGGGIYQGTIPGQSMGTKVVFYITSTDTEGETGRYPIDIEERSHPLVLNPSNPSLNDQRFLIYRHDDKPTDFFFRYRFFMTNNHESTLSSRKRLSNDLVPGSFLFGSSRMHYESKTRFAGSPFARGGWGGSFRVAFPRHDLFRGKQRKFNIDNHHGNGLDARERISHYLLRQQNVGSARVPYLDNQTVIRWEVNDRTNSVLEEIWVPDTQYIDLWYPEDSDGDFYEVDDRFEINDNGDREGNTNAEVRYPPGSASSDNNGENPENYRWFFGLRSKNGLDDYQPLIDFARVFDDRTTGNAAFDQQIFDICDVEEFLRIWGVRLNTDDWDTWGANRGKNCYLYMPGVSGQTQLFAWDMELTYGNPNAFGLPTNPFSNYNPGRFGEVHRFFNRPEIKRLYYSILDEMVNGSGRWFHSSYLGDFMDELGQLGMGNLGKAAPGGFIDQRASQIQTRIADAVYPRQRLRITTNSGNNFTTNNATVNLAGTAPADAAILLVAGERYPTSFSSMTNWTINDIPLIPGANRLDVVGFNLRGDLVDTDSITVTSTAVEWDPPVITSIDPTSALPGDVIEIFGSDFRNGLTVLFGTTPGVSVIYDETGPTPDRIVCTVPSRPSGPVNVTVRNLDNKTSNSVNFVVEEPPPTFIRGDANRDDQVNISDGLKILFHLFRGQVLLCRDAADADDNEAVQVTDTIFLLNFLFTEGPSPRAPFPQAGFDPSGAGLDCLE